VLLLRLLRQLIRSNHKRTREAQVHRRMILEVGTDTRSIDHSVDIKRVEQILRSNAAELKQTWRVDRTRRHDDILASNEPGAVREVAAVDLDSGSRSAVAFKDDLRTIVPHEQVQVGAVADGFIVGYAS
jgi:hypothetical protein